MLNFDYVTYKLSKYVLQFNDDHGVKKAALFFPVSVNKNKDCLTFSKMALFEFWRQTSVDFPKAK